MANTLGQLIVRLGLDAADFTSGLSKSEHQARRFADSLSNKVAIGVVKAQVAIEAFQAAVELAVNAVPRLIEQAAGFQDLAEKTGASAEMLASFGVAAGTSSTAMDTVAASSVKLSAALSKTEDESKGVGAALKAINLPLKDFKALDPGAQMEALANSLARFEDGAEKTAIAVALFGKAGAELLPFLKELGQAGGRQNILTAEQIKRADQYADSLARTKAQLNLYAQAMATSAIPALDAIAEATKDVIKQMISLDGQVDDLATSRAILDWAEQAAMAIAAVGDVAIDIVKLLRVLTTSFDSMVAHVEVAKKFSYRSFFTEDGKAEFAAALAAREKAVAGATKAQEALNGSATPIGDAVRRGFENQRRMMDPENRREAERFARQAAQAVGPKKRINTKGLVADEGGGGSTAAAELRKSLDGYLKGIRDFAEQQRAGYEFANQYVKNVYEEGLTSLADFLERQKALREAGLQTHLEQIDREISALQKLRDSPLLKPQERIDAENRIAEAVRNRAQAVQRAAQANILATQQEAKEVKQLAYSYYDFLSSVSSLRGDDAGAAAIRIAKQTRDAQELLTKVGFDDTAAREQSEAFGRLLAQTESLNRLQREYGRLVETAGVREGEVTLAAQQAGLSEIETLRSIASVRQDALGGMSDLVTKAHELAAALGTPEARLYADKLALQFRQAAAEADPLLQKVREVGREMGDSFAGHVEDSLLARGKTMRERFVGLLEGIGADATRIMTRQLVTKPVADWFAKTLGGDGQTGGGLLAGLFGGGKAASGKNTAQEAFRSAEIAAQNVAEPMAMLTSNVVSQTTAYAAGTTALGALTSAAQSAAFALTALRPGGGSLPGMPGSMPFGDLFGGTGSMFSPGGWASSGFGTGAAFGNMDLGLFLHSGGIVGSGADIRPVPTGVFAGAPRFHDGGIPGAIPAAAPRLKANEIPAILLRNEEVLTAADPRHRDNLTPGVEKAMSMFAKAPRYHTGGIAGDAPDMVDVRGRQFLSASTQRAQSARVPAKTAGGDTNLYVTVPMPQGGSRETAMQFGQTVGRHAQRSLARNGR